MAYPFSLPNVAFVAVAGIGLGLGLGQSAISEINPAYFGSHYSEARFHADLVPGGANYGNAPQLRDATLEYGLGSGCVGCRTYPEEYYPIHDPAVDTYADDTSAVADRIVQDADRDLAQIEGQVKQASLERYAHYQIETGEKPAKLAQASLSEPSAEGDAEAGQQDKGTPGI